MGGRMRQHVMANEYQMLLDFESKDAALAQKLAKAQKAKEDVAHEIDSCGEKLVQKQEELAVWQEKDKLIMEEFSKLVGASNQFEPQLLKMFKRKIKRAKKRTEDDDEDDDDDDEEDACPPGCDQTLYDKVLELREKGLDQEEILSDFQKAIDDLKKANERHHGRERQIDKDLQGTELEIEAFQTEKQQKLNELDISIMMKLNQIVCLICANETSDKVEENDTEEQPLPTDLPDSISNCLFF